MNIEQQEHRICEIIRAVCERNDVGVMFSTEPASAGTGILMCVRYDLGRERKRVNKRRGWMLGLSTGLTYAMFVVVVSYGANAYSSVTLALCAAWFGSSLFDVVRGESPPLVSQLILDCDIAIALAVEGHSVEQSGDTTHVYFARP
jgi:hypothetical protein